MVKKVRASASRTSRHKKKYWRKGADVGDLEKSIYKSDEVQAKEEYEASTTERIPHKIKYTKRQQAALNRLSRNMGQQEHLPLPPPKFPSLKKQPKLKQPIEQPVTESCKKKDVYDLWEKDIEPKVDVEFKEAGEHLLRYTKKKLPKMPKTCRFKPSLLDAVAIPNAGTSYNPEANDYKSYISKIAMEEVKLMEEEERIQKASQPKFESVVTHEEKQFEEIEGLAIDPRYNADDDEASESKTKEDVEMSEDGAKEGEKIVISHLQRKTRKQKLKAAREKKIQRELKRRKEIEKKQHDVFKAKSINKKLECLDKESLDRAARRKREKFLKKMTTRQRLGRGEFKDGDEPFLLQEELGESLRQLKPQGHVLNDHLISLQKRNMLPIGGDRNKKKLKAKLKLFKKNQSSASARSKFST